MSVPRLSLSAEKLTRYGMYLLEYGLVSGEEVGDVSVRPKLLCFSAGDVHMG